METVQRRHRLSVDSEFHIDHPVLDTYAIRMQLKQQNQKSSSIVIDCVVCIHAALAQGARTAGNGLGRMIQASSKSILSQSIHGGEGSSRNELGLSDGDGD